MIALIPVAMTANPATTKISPNSGTGNGTPRSNAMYIQKTAKPEKTIPKRIMKILRKLRSIYRLSSDVSVYLSFAGFRPIGPQ